MKAYSERRLRSVILLLSLAVLGLTLGFNALLSVSALDRLATEAILSAYQGDGKNMAKSIERGMRFGKPLSHYAGMEDVLQDFCGNNTGVVAVRIETVQETVPYVFTCGSGTLNRYGIAEEVTVKPFPLAKVSGHSDEYQEFPDCYRVRIPLHAPALVGWVIIDVTKQAVEEGTQRFAQWSFALVGGCCLIVGVILDAWVRILIQSDAVQSDLGPSLIKLLVLLVGGTQLIYSLAILGLFAVFAEDSQQVKATSVAQSVKRDFEYLVHKGVTISSLRGLDGHLAQVLASNPELAEVALLRPDLTILAQAGVHIPDATRVEGSIDAYWPSRFLQRQEILRIRLSLAPSVLTDNLIKLGIDLLTALVISLLLLFELAKLLSLIAAKLLWSVPAAETGGVSTDIQTRTLALRAAGFLFFLAYDMGISFIPMMAQKLYAPMWGLSEAIVTGLPISFEMMFAGVALLLAGNLTERLGWRQTFALGAVMATVGLVLAGMATTLPMLVMARAVAGTGFGLILMTAQIATLGNSGAAGADMASLFAGIFSGSIFGSAAGAMLADRFGYEVVFLIAAMVLPLSALVLPLGGVWRAKDAGEGGVRKVGIKTSPPAESGYLVFISSPRVLSLLMLVGLPVALCLTGFLHYQLPLMLQAAHVEQSDIGRVFMLYGLCFITVGAILGKWIDRTQRLGTFAAIAALLSGVSLLVAATYTGLIGAVFAVICIGVSQCISAPATMLSVVHLGAAQTLGKDKTASIYRTLERVGQVLGPVLFGSVIAMLGMSQALLWIGSAVCGGAVLYWCLARLNIFPE